MINGTKRFFAVAMVAVALLPMGVFGQSFNVSSTSVSEQGVPNSWFEAHTDVANLTMQTLKVDIEFTQNTLPPDWEFTFCLANCFAPGVLKVTDEMEPGSTVPLKLTITTGPTAGSGTVVVTLKNHNNPAESITITFNLSATSSAINSVIPPKQLTLSQNYPNPVSMGGAAVTTIGYSVPRASQVTMKVFNLLGKEVRTLVNEGRQAGSYNAIWDGKDYDGNIVPPGVYVYKISSGKNTLTKRMLITR